MNLSHPPLKDIMLRTPDEKFAAAHTAILVIDMQNDFCAEGGYIEAVVGKDAAACRAVVAPIMSFVGAARAAKVPVYWIRANYDLETLPAGMAAKFAMQGKGKVCCASGSWGADFFGCTPAANEDIVEKRCFSGFIGTDLEARLRKAGIRSIVLAGVQTNICVDSTLRDGLALGFHVAIASDCVASHTPHLHDATLANVRLAMGDVLSAAEFAAMWARAG
ncbi:MAG: cysteine hydrolase [Rhodospirillaceae bacterium]|nr:cysteine hydrolase [Rhodospirillaceae bacterium]